MVCNGIFGANKMKVGDLVRHKMNGKLGIIIEVRRGTLSSVINSCVVLWTDGWKMMHPYGQLEEM